MNEERITELTLKELDGELTEEESRELDELVSSDAGSKLHASLLEQEAALRGGRAEIDVHAKVLEQLAAHERVERRVLHAIEPWSWIGGRRFWQVAAAACLALVLMGGGHYAWIASRKPAPEEVLVFGDTLVPGRPAAYRALLRNAESGAPLAGDVELAIVARDKGRVWESRVHTDKDGIAVFRDVVPASLVEGDYTLEVRSDGLSDDAVVVRPVKVKRSFKLYVATDKPLYQPGQTIHMRALALDSSDLAPVKKHELVLEVRDGRSNKVFKQRLQTSRFGLASADFALADQVNMGSYSVSASIGDTTSERRVTVERYTLPKFKVEAETDASFYRPGATVHGKVRALYTFGKAVAGASVEVAIDAGTRSETTTNHQGQASFSLELPKVLPGNAQGEARVAFEVRVRDSAGHEQRQRLERVVSEKPIRIVAVPEAGGLVPDVDNVVYLLASQPDGRPVKTRLHVSPPDKDVETNEAGIAQVTLRPEGTALHVTGQDIDETLSLTAGPAVLLQTDRAIYTSGDSATIRVLSARHRGPVFVDIVKDGRTVISQRLENAGELVVDLPPDVFGTLAVHAYYFGAEERLKRVSRLVQVNRKGDLRIEAKLDRARYRPGETAKLTLAVSDKSGAPKAAALSLAAVDEAVFALQESRPGLERVHFLLEQELLKPRYEIHGIDASAVEDDQRARVLFSSVAVPGGIDPQGPQSYAGRRDALVREQRAHALRLKGALAILPTIVFLFLTLPLLAYGVRRAFEPRPIDADEAERREVGRALQAVVHAWILGLVAPAVLALFGVLMQSMEAVLSFALVGVVAALVLMVRRARALPASPPLLRKLLSWLPAAYVAGIVAIASLIWAVDSPRWLSDETAFFVALVVPVAWALVIGIATAANRSFVQPMGAGAWLWLFASRTGLAALPLLLLASTMMMTARSPVEQRAAGDDVDAVRPTAAASEPSSVTRKVKDDAQLPPRVRRHFPETLLWRPELITDEKGRASLDVPLADSITTWRLAMSAVSDTGALGATDVGIEVFQDFFVDLDLPVALVQNDAVSVPVTIYNYLDKPQTVRLTLGAASWFELRGSSVKSVRVEPRSVSSSWFEIVAKKPGEHALALEAASSELSDAIERRVRIEPDGERVEQTINGELREHREHDVVVPDEAIEGANDLVLKVYPGTFSQVAEGMEGVFQMPNGCFEQTSSTTYPSLLVLDYMRRSKQLEPELETKALGFLGVGYQRLLSFEVEGGGFEWFGKAPAHVVLTAYGLMQFTDMARVREVDPAIVERTANWLYGQQRGDGTWLASEHGIAEGAVNAQQGNLLRTTAYVAWALAGARSDDARLARALDFIEAGARTEKDAYTLALSAHALAAGKREVAPLLDALASMAVRGDEGMHWKAAGEGLTYSGGDTLSIETTALAAHALLTSRHTATAHAALSWILRARDPHGTWRSTQATVAAMRALLAATSPARTQLAGPVSVRVSVNGDDAGVVRLDPETSDVHQLISLRDRVQKGVNHVRLQVEGKGRIAYQLVASHYRPRPPGEPKQEPLSVAVHYDVSSLKPNDLLPGRVSVRYNQPGRANMILVDVGIPAGFSAVPEQLDLLVTQRLIERYSITGSQMQLYLRELASGQTLELPFQLRALYPVKVQAPPPRGYLYYDPSQRGVGKPTSLTVL
ncbi:MAG TPA: MG2 domain-containing protein [Polyangiaceae bacterium]|nr:MG2 domain-containing protein [Polyangiaceae bacterium]